MCGIAGFISPNKNVNKKAFVSMLDIIEHRGPDDKGIALWSQTSSLPQNDENDSYILGLGHRRLSIVDLSPLGHQPMPYKNDRYWLVYNGEIYNHIELREELVQLGHSFRSQSDSEIILAAYDQWGIDCLHKFNGMWSFALYDIEEEKLFLARDRFGVKPLYYWQSTDGTLYFGSEIKQFTVLPDWQAVMNAQRSYEFLVWGLMDHTNETMFKDVFQIQPGHLATLDVKAAKLEQVKWYNLKGTPFKGNFEDAAKRFHDLLSDSVRLRLRADVAVGSCLSGGLDSSSLVCLMNKELPEGAGKQKTFSATADEKKYDESPWIREVVNKTAVDAHYVHPSFDKLFDLSEKITWHQDEPFGSTSIYAQWNVFELASKNDVIVMLDGQGADEQLAGYHGFFAPLYYGLFKSGQWIRLFREIRLIKKYHGYSPLKALEHIANMMLPEFVKSPLKRLLGRNHKAPTWLDVKGMGVNVVDPHIKLGSYVGSINALCYSQLTSSNLQALLHWEDRNSMAHSLESRVPFLDYRLVEFSMGLPDDFKISGGKTKLILREAMSGILPDKIRDRVDKLGFATPEEVWFKKNGTELFKQKLDESIRILNGLVTEEIRDYFDDVVSEKKPFSFTLWRVINFAQWVKVFNVNLSVVK
jgi:asparagine synthase (glutamine-hydrolysing)